MLPRTAHNNIYSALKRAIYQPLDAISVSMKSPLIYILIFFLATTFVNAQDNILRGKVITEELDELPGVQIYDQDTSQLGTTDISGNFQLTISNQTEELIFSFIGMEWLSIPLTKGCDFKEVIVLAQWTYHYKSHRKTDRQRKEQFDNRIQLHRRAFEKGIFENESPCIVYEFIPAKPELDEIRDWMRGQKTEIKTDFQQLSVGDTIYVPYSTSWKYDGTNRTSLFSYSSYVDGTEFKCLIQGTVIDKNTRKNGYNLKFEVASCENCDYESIVLDDKIMEVGEVFEQNMKYFKVITDIEKVTASNSTYE